MTGDSRLTPDDEAAIVAIHLASRVHEKLAFERRRLLPAVGDTDGVRRDAVVLGKWITA